MNEFVDPFGKDEPRRASIGCLICGSYDHPTSEHPEQASEHGAPQASDDRAPQASDEHGEPKASENPDPEDPDWEQALRDRMGYSPTEKRTKAERDAAAQRMLGNRAQRRQAAKATKKAGTASAATTMSASDEIVLPADIAAVWGHSDDDIKTATYLIGVWGLDRFRDSQLHKAALQEARSAKDRAANQRAFLDAQKRLKK